MFVDVNVNVGVNVGVELPPISLISMPVQMSMLSMAHKQHIRYQITLYTTRLYWYTAVVYGGAMLQNKIPSLYVANHMKIDPMYR